MRHQIKNKEEAGTSTSAGSICKTGVVSSTAACSEIAVEKKKIPNLVSFWSRGIGKTNARTGGTNINGRP